MTKINIITRLNFKVIINVAFLVKQLFVSICNFENPGLFHLCALEVPRAITEPKPVVDLHKFKHPNDEQLRLLVISSNSNLPSVLFGLIYTTVVLYAGGWPFSSCKSPMQVSTAGVSNSLRSYPGRL